MPRSGSQLALLGGKPVGEVKQPPFPVFSARARRRVAQLLEQSKVLAFDRNVPEVREAESALSKYHGGRHVMTLSSGHASLQMALAGLDIADGDEVITTPYSYAASTSCILHQNAIPIFADVNRNTGLIDAKAIEERITSRTRGILVVHLYGHPCDMTAIMRVANRHGLPVIEDGSQAHGATWKGVGVGNFGMAAGFSCMGGKQLAASEAGYLVAKDRDVYWRASLYCQHMGRSTEQGFPDEFLPYVDSLVYTYRITAHDAVLLTEQLKKLPREIEGRRQNIAHLRTRLADSKYLSWPQHSKHGNPSHYMWTMNFRSEVAGIHRDTFLKAVQAEGLPMANYLSAVIPTSSRLQWKNYRGPRPPWLSNLRRSKVVYRSQDVPNACYKFEHALELLFRFYKPMPKTMDRIADILYKVEDNIDALRAYEKKNRM